MLLAQQGGVLTEEFRHTQAGGHRVQIHHRTALTQHLSHKDNLPFMQMLKLCYSVQGKPVSVTKKGITTKVLN